MASTTLFEIGDGVLQEVAHSLNYSSLRSLDEDVKKLKEWMEKQPHFPEIMDKKYIQNFLILNKGSVERSKEKINNYYSVRSQLPEIFEQINPKLPYMSYTLDSVYLVPLPKLTKEGYRVFFNKMKDPSVDNFNPGYMFRYLINLQELRLAEDVMFGDIFIIDGKDIPLSAILQITPTMVYKAIIVVYKRIFSNRLKGVYLINAPFYTDSFLLLLKTVLKPKLLERIHICPNSDFLIERFGKEILPEDYGGNEKSLYEIQKMVARKFKQHEERYDKLDKLRINEKLRPEELKNDEIFGFHGNFKKLEVD